MTLKMRQSVFALRGRLVVVRREKVRCDSTQCVVSYMDNTYLIGEPSYEYGGAVSKKPNIRPAPQKLQVRKVYG